DDAAGAVDAGVSGLIGLLGRVEQGFGQTIDAHLSLFGGGGGGEAGVFGGGLKGGQGAAGLLDQGVGGLGGQAFKLVEGQFGGAVEAVGLALGHVDQGAELVRRRLDQILDRLRGALGGVAQILGDGAGGGQLLGQLGALALDLGGEVFLVGP